MDFSSNTEPRGPPFCLCVALDSGSSAAVDAFFRFHLTPSRRTTSRKKLKVVPLRSSYWITWFFLFIFFSSGYRTPVNFSECMEGGPAVEVVEEKEASQGEGEMKR